MERRLEDSCRFLRGVGPQRAAALERLDVRTVEDLLLHIPRAYFDRRQVVRLADLTVGMACVRAHVTRVVARRAWRGRSTFHARVEDDSGSLHVVWYGAWAREVLQPGVEVLLAGPVAEVRGKLEMRQPEFERLDAEGTETLHGGRIVPLYGLTRGLSQKWLRDLMHRTLQEYGPSIGEVLPAAVRGERPDRATAFGAVHFPADADAVTRARDRLAFEELFFHQLLLARRRVRVQRSVRGPRFERARGLQAQFLAELPFALTGAQARVLEEILVDLESGAWMQRLVQGDVGAGKTVVAAAALLLAIGNGWQGALMVPTESLAIQHAERLLAPCSRLGVRLDVLVGSRSERDKAALRARMAGGAVDLVVGTHALIQEGVTWARLGLAVVDEQHRFGVLQRGALHHGSERPHVLVMSATPIPRSLALTVFGDLDVSRLDEKPPGRLPVRTRIVPPSKHAALLTWVREALQAGQQAFMVVPLVEESEGLDLRAATAEFERLQAGPLAGSRLGLLHGRLPAAEKERLRRDFERGAVQMLVCTTIVEVGIDIANASIMIIHHPERFGLSQLHQLRGRVGRGEAESWCFLLADAQPGTPSSQRLHDFAATEDGFRIAELDLARRGPGDFVGTRQHGLPSLRIADLATDMENLDAARSCALDLVELDADLTRSEHACVRTHLETRYAERQVLAEIG